jgi:uroporphyrinogen-III synthase
MNPLAGRGVLVTRPAHQAEPLCELLEARGARPIRFPVLAIAPPADVDSARQRLARLADYHRVVFISVNAVDQAAALRGGLPADLCAAVVGRASARALREHGVAAVLQPVAGADSEALLALPELRAVAGRRILIVRGEGGRELLADTLRARGATVDYAEVYRRVCPDVDPEALAALWRTQRIDAVTATSNETLGNLYQLAGPAGRDPLRATPLVVASPRAADLAAELGWTAPVRVAASAEDVAMVAALIDVLVA